MAAEWWNPNGKFVVLHKFNPVRIAYIQEELCARFGRDPFVDQPLEGLELLDIGCGGGLLSEPMARLGAKVTGVDPSEKNIKTAMVHASITYRATSAEALAAEGAKFDAILNMEVVEHVKDPAHFMAITASMVKPGGVMFTATLNRTLKSFGLAIIGAEYVLGWLPKGTHQWEKFISPEELAEMLRQGGLSHFPAQGVTFNPFTNKWKRSRDIDVNYMVIAERPE
jgi:2-polyprenyl-6-hydroxyphenyl methylase/3-demethylubiquinone-9 3-methyltransferase